MSIISLASWYLVFPAISLIIIVYFLRKYYVETGRELKRLEAKGSKLFLILASDCILHFFHPSESPIIKPHSYKHGWSFNHSGSEDAVALHEDLRTITQ